MKLVRLPQRTPSPAISFARLLKDAPFALWPASRRIHIAPLRLWRKPASPYNPSTLPAHFKASASGASPETAPGKNGDPRFLF